MKKQKVFWTSDEMCERIRQKAFDERISESELIRRSVDMYLDEKDSKK